MKSKNLSEQILRLIKSKGFNNIELDPVLETKYILQRSGENFKKLLFSFYDLNGKELCLSRGLGDVYKRQLLIFAKYILFLILGLIQYY